MPDLARVPVLLRATEPEVFSAVHAALRASPHLRLVEEDESSPEVVVVLAAERRERTVEDDIVTGRPRRGGAAAFSRRETAVLRLLAEGCSTGEVAELLNYSERTIKGIVHGVTERFGLRNRSHAVAFALREGVI